MQLVNLILAVWICLVIFCYVRTSFLLWLVSFVSSTIFTLAYGCHAMGILIYMTEMPRAYTLQCIAFFVRSDYRLGGLVVFPCTYFTNHLSDDSYTYI